MLGAPPTPNTRPFFRVSCRPSAKNGDICRGKQVRILVALIVERLRLASSMARSKVFKSVRVSHLKDREEQWPTPIQGCLYIITPCTNEPKRPADVHTPLPKRGTYPLESGLETTEAKGYEQGVCTSTLRTKLAITSHSAGSQTRTCVLFDTGDSETQNIRDLF